MGPSTAWRIWIREKTLRRLVDLDDLAPGEYMRKLAAEFPKDLTLLDISPPIVDVKIFGDNRRRMNSAEIVRHGRYPGSGERLSHDDGTGHAGGKRRGLCVQKNQTPPQGSHRQRHPAVRIYARKRHRRRDLLHGRRRHAGGPAADAGNRLFDPQHEGRCGHRHFRFPQSFSGQRHQSCSGRTDSSCPINWNKKSKSLSSATRMDALRPTAEDSGQGLPHQRFAGPLHRVPEKHLSSAT